MATRFSIPAPTFADAYLTANNLDRSAFDLAVAVATSQYNISEGAKEYANGIAKSEMYIGLDLERIMAVELGAIKTQIAKDRAMYKSKLADSVKQVKIQQAHLEGQFGIDMASAKREFDLRTLENISTREEETATTISYNEYASSVTLSYEAEDSASRVNRAEDLFIRTLSDSDYEASVANADTRATKIQQRGVLEKSSAAIEGAVSNYGIVASGNVEVRGMGETALVQRQSIFMQADSDVNLIQATHELKKGLIQAQSVADLYLIESQTDTKVTSTRLETEAQILSEEAQSKLNIQHIEDTSLLEAKYIGIDAAAQDQ